MRQDINKVTHPLLIVGLIALTSLIAVACDSDSDGKSGSVSGGSEQGGITGGNMGASNGGSLGGSDEPIVLSCERIFICALLCATDDTQCQQDCLDYGTPEAQRLYISARACLDRECPDDMCPDNTCQAELEACAPPSNDTPTP